MADTSYWIPDLLPKQFEIFNSYKRYVLAEGSKMTGKTRANLHKVARHLWETDRAEIGMLVRLTKSAKNSGIWDELCVTVLEEWMAHGYFYGKWEKPGPMTTDGVTKVPYFTLKNMHGTISRCSLYNCEDDTDAERRVKGCRFSMVYIPEATNFTVRAAFDAVKVQLRCLHLRYEDHQILLDCNPAEDGEESWLYKLWMVEKYLPDPTPDQKQFRDELHQIHFEIADNPRLDPREVSDLKAAYEYSPDLYSRYIQGKWTATTLNSHFSDLFIPNLHIIGDATNANKDNWEIITPDENCHELITSWDMGAVNHSAHIMQKRIVEKQICFDVIDELVFLKKQISIEDFALMMLDKMDEWELFLKREFGVNAINWRHWSDDSAFYYRSAADSHEELIVRNVTEGRVMLAAAPKAKGMVKQRVNLVRKLLFQKRLFFSAQLFETIRMVKGLKKGQSQVDFVDRLDPLKHIFDSLTYGLIAEAPLDAQNRPRPNVEKRSSVVMVGV
jgi:hypothetical protein